MPRVTLYRGDSRTPKQIVQAKGFKAWVPLDYVQARILVKQFCGAATPANQLKLPSSTKTTIGRLNNVRSKLTNELVPLNPADLGRLIISQKTRDAIWVSTAKDDDCGGYSSAGYVYKMTFDFALIKGAINQNSTGMPIKRTLGLWPKLWLDSAKLDTSRIIAIDQFGGNMGGEVSFLTSIPLANIKGYRPSGKRSGTPFIPFHRYTSRRR